MRFGKGNYSRETGRNSRLRIAQSITLPETGPKFSVAFVSAVATVSFSFAKLKLAVVNDVSSTHSCEL